VRVALWSHVICGLAFWALTLALLFRGRSTPTRFGLAVFSGIMAIWAATVAASIQFDLSPLIEAILEMARTLAIIGFTILLIRRSFPAGGLGRAFEVAWSPELHVDLRNLKAVIGPGHGLDPCFGLLR